MIYPTTKIALLAAIREGYTAFETLLAPLTATQLTTPGVNDDWSIKDILAHLATWQDRIASRLEAFLAHNLEFQLNPQVGTEEAMHAFNTSTFLANQTRPLAEIWHAFRSTYQRIITCVELLDEQALFDPQRFPTLDNTPIVKIIAGDTFEHYAEHTSMIKQWLAS